ncbi:rab-GTPase-TBC domain-containing protein, partial [Lineolata rhizophorae]
SRRQSWQPGRKTVAELEAEYDDGDEEVPDDAVIWNVPLSPRAPMDRSASHSSVESAGAGFGFGPGPAGSTATETSAATTTGTATTTNVPPPAERHNSAPAVTAASSSSSVVAPATSAASSAVPSPTASTFGAAGPELPPQQLLMKKIRNKSWTAAMSDLSPEARNLTEALEAYAEENERKHEERVQQGQGPTPPSSATSTTGMSAAAAAALEKQRVSSTSIELPPVQKSNIMIDPLPVSKEKEKHLTRTRPSWLPPKNPKEERRHLREWQRMMARSLEADRRRAERAREERQARDQRELARSRTWERAVLPDFPAVLRDRTRRETRELWWRGVPPRCRAEVWTRAIGNELELSDASYAAALGRARGVEAKLEALGDAEERRAEVKEALWFDAIARDARDTFPELKIFQADGGPLHEALKDVLMAFTMYRSDVGYVHGTHLIAALLLLNLPGPATAFVALANVMNRPLPMAFLVHDTAAMARAYACVLAHLALKRPRLHAHLTGRLGLRPDQFLEPLFRTLFCAGAGSGVGVAAPAAATSAGVDVACRIWDVVVFEGDAALVRAALGTLASLESRLYGDVDEVLGLLGWR